MLSCSLSFRDSCITAGFWQGNTLSADCGNSSYTYLDICNSLLNGSSSTPAASPSAAPGVAPAAAPSAPALSSPAAALEASPASAPSSVSNQAANRFVTYCCYRCIMYFIVHLAAQSCIFSAALPSTGKLSQSSLLSAPRTM